MTILTQRFVITGSLPIFHCVLSFTKKVIWSSNTVSYSLVWLFIRKLGFDSLKSLKVRHLAPTFVRTCAEV